MKVEHSSLNTTDCHSITHTLKYHMKHVQWHCGATGSMTRGTFSLCWYSWKHICSDLCSLPLLPCTDLSKWSWLSRTWFECSFDYHGHYQITTNLPQISCTAILKKYQASWKINNLTTLKKNYNWTKEAYIHLHGMAPAYTEFFHHIEPYCSQNHHLSGTKIYSN